MAERTKKKIIPGRTDSRTLEEKTRTQSGVILKPSIPDLYNDAMLIMAHELAHYRSKVVGGLPLDLKEARIVQGYAKNLKEMSEEAREYAKDAPAEKLTDDELIKIVQGDNDGKEAGKS